MPPTDWSLGVQRGWPLVVDFYLLHYLNQLNSTFSSKYLTILVSKMWITNSGEMQNTKVNGYDFNACK